MASSCRRLKGRCPYLIKYLRETAGRVLAKREYGRVTRKQDTASVKKNKKKVGKGYFRFLQKYI